MIPERYNASLLLDASLEAGRGEKVAIHCGDETVTYSELLRRTCRCGHALRALGAGRGDRVLLVLDDLPALPALFLGAIRIGAVPVPLNPFYGAGEYRYFVEDSGAALVVADPARAEAVRAGVGGAIDPARVLAAGGGTGSFDDLAEGQPDGLDPAPTHPGDTAFWLYSSGSTGKPKGVVHRQRDLLSTCETYARHVLGIGEDDVTFSTTKLFHAYGLGNSLSFPYWAGASTVLLSGRPTPEAVFGAVRRFRPTLFFSVPTLYNALLHAPGAAEQDFSSVRACVSAAEALPAEVWHRWRSAYGLTILDGIGSTELLHIYCSNTLADVVPGSSGRRVPGYELKLLDEGGDEIAGEGTGDLYVRGDSALAGYWGEPERTAESLSRDGWFWSRDRYRRDADGYYWYEGRADDMFKVSGLWVSPAEVESALIEHPAVLEAAVVGVTIDGFTRAKAFVIPRDPAGEAASLEQELRRHCGRRLHGHQQPALFELVPELPKTLTGKIQRFKLRAEG